MGINCSQGFIMKINDIDVAVLEGRTSYFITYELNGSTHFTEVYTCEYYREAFETAEKIKKCYGNVMLHWKI